MGVPAGLAWRRGSGIPDNDVVLAVRGLAAADLPAIKRIVGGLPDYFTSDVPGRVEEDAVGHDGWAVTDVGEAAGFAVAARRSPGGGDLVDGG